MDTGHMDRGCCIAASNPAAWSWTMERWKVVGAAAWAWPAPMGLGRPFDGRRFVWNVCLERYDEAVERTTERRNLGLSSSCGDIARFGLVLQGVLSRPRRVQLVSAKLVFWPIDQVHLPHEVTLATPYLILGFWWILAQWNA